MNKFKFNEHNFEKTTILIKKKITSIQHESNRSTSRRLHLLQSNQTKSYSNVVENPTKTTISIGRQSNWSKKNSYK